MRDENPWPGLVILALAFILPVGFGTDWGVYTLVPVGMILVMALVALVVDPR